MRKSLRLLVAGFFVVMFFSVVVQQAMAQQWIWYPEAGGNPLESAPAATRYFVKVVTVDAIKSASLEITADNSYKLYINGKMIGEGKKWEEATVYNLAKNLVKGKNVIAIEATNVDGPAGIIFKGKITPAAGKSISLDSSSKWLSSDKATKGWLEGTTDKTWLKALELANFGEGPWGANVVSKTMGQ